ncbi:YitT family protein [Brevibacterium sp. JNUCC-42]|nr:YitT family protein [Brevibacterium sp. JNUCC-42]
MKYMIRKGIAVIVGSVLLALGVNGFIIPHQLMDGGLTGIALIINYMVGYKVGLVMIITSIPIYLYAWFTKRAYFYNSINGLLFSSFLIDLFSPLQHVPTFTSFSLLSSSILGGLFIGTGIGLLLKFNTATDGFDLMAKFLSDLTRINIGIFIFVFDMVILFIGSQLADTPHYFYSLLAISIVSLVTFLWNRQGIVHE